VDVITEAIKMRTYGVALRDDMRVEEMAITADLDTAGAIMAHMHTAGVIIPGLDMDMDGAVKRLGRDDNA